MKQKSDKRPDWIEAILGDLERIDQSSETACSSRSRHEADLNAYENQDHEIAIRGIQETISEDLDRLNHLKEDSSELPSNPGGVEFDPHSAIKKIIQDDVRDIPKQVIDSKNFKIITQFEEIVENIEPEEKRNFFKALLNEIENQQFSSYSKIAEILDINNSTAAGWMAKARASQHLGELVKTYDKIQKSPFRRMLEPPTKIEIPDFDIIIDAIKPGKMQKFFKILLSEVKKNAFTSFHKIAKSVKINPQTVSIRLKKMSKDPWLGPLIAKYTMMKDAKREKKIKKWIDLYKKIGNVHKVAKLVNASHSEIWRQLEKRGIIEKGIIPPEEIPKIIKKYRKGASLEALGQEYHVNLGSIRYHLLKHGVEMHGSGDWKKVKIIEPKEFTPKLAMLIALIITEGYLSENRVGIKNTSYALIDEFKNLIKNTFYIDSFYERIDDDNNPNHKIRYICEMKSVELSKFLFRYIDKTDYQSAKLPEEFFTLPNKIICDLLKVAFSADGSVSLRPYKSSKSDRWHIVKQIEFACTSTSLIKQWYDLIERVGIRCRIYRDHIIISGKENILKFKEKIGFLDGIKIMKNTLWENYTRGEILDALVESYKCKEKGFVCKDKALEFLKSLLNV